MNKPSSINRNAKIQKFISGMFIGTAIFLAGCATTGVNEQQNIAKKDDPYESFNRKVYSFNDNVDDYVAKPVSDAYQWVTPQFVQTGVYNFFSNLKNINVIINDILQAKFAQSAHDTGRFALNTTLGLGGFLDVGKDVGLEQNNEDFEQTLAVWGVPRGSYLVLPFLGPTTMRGIPGSVFDSAVNPANYVGLPVQLISLLNARASAEGALKFIDEAALDPYVFTRESFLQWRHNLDTDGKSEASLDFDDALDEDGAGPTAKSSGNAVDNKKGSASQENSETKNPRTGNKLELLPPSPSKTEPE